MSARARQAGAWAILATLACSVAAEAARKPIQREAPQILRLRLRDPTLAFEVEGSRDRTQLPDEPANRDNIRDWTPSLGLGMDGSVYHPELLLFSLDAELGSTEGTRTQDDGMGDRQRDRRHFDVQRFNGSATILRSKPYSLTLFGRKERDRRSYDELNRFDVDTEYYGVSTRHQGRAFDWDAQLSHKDERTSDTDRPTTDLEDNLTINGYLRRPGGSATTIRYERREFTREEDGDIPQDGVQQTVYAQDEAFTSADRESRLLSSVHLTDLDDSDMNSRTLTLREDGRRRVRPDLWNGAVYQYDRREAGEATSDQHSGELYAEHQLYDSLHTRLDVQAERDRSQAPDSRETALRYGPGLGAYYTKKLRAFGNLAVDADYRLDILDRTSSGDAQVVVDENIVLQDGAPAFLSRPGVEPGGVRVTDADGGRRYVEDVDYRVVTRGSYAEIQRVFGGAIPNGSSVLVDYTTDGATDDHLYRVERRVGVELDLWERLLFLYAHERAAVSVGDDSLIYQDYHETVAGLKSRLSWIEMGLEFADYSADALSYDGMSCFTDLFWDGDSLSLKLHAGRSDITYRDHAGRLDTRTYTATCDWHPLPSLSLQVFAGDYHEDSESGQRDVVSAEGRLNYIISRLTLEGTYRYENEDAQREQHERHYYLVKVKRAL